MKNILIAFLVAATLMMSCCVENVGQQTSETNKIYNATTRGNNELAMVEVIHFHGNSQCYSCKTVGAYAEETVNTYFPDEVASGKLVFKHVNYDLPENRALAVKYGVTGSSLWIGTYTTKGNFTAEQNINVWYKINDKEEYMTYLKGIIDKKLAGE